MARKNLLGALMGAPETKAATPPKARPKGTKAPAKGAVGAVSQTIAELKARAVAEIDPHMIEAGGLADRLEYDEADHARLMDSIREYGQQVPVLVRPHPDKPNRYQIVYGRRRVLALRDLGVPAKAMIREMDDETLILAQGQENSARRDLSFIEKANFARQMRDVGYKRKIICDALSIDKTQISRMLSIIDRIPEGVAEAIGSAPGIGRDRWATFADLAEVYELSDGEARALAHGATSDVRFESLMTAMTLPRRRAQDARAKARRGTAAKPVRLTGADGAELGRARRAKDKTTLVLTGEDGFADWLVENLGDIHRNWQDR